MAKSRTRPVDKVERQARLANARRHQQLEQSDIRNAHRLGWNDDDYDQADDHQWDDQDEAA